MAQLGFPVIRLTAGARRALPFIESAVRQGVSVNQLQRTLTESGMGVRRQTLFELRRYYLGIQQEEPRVAQVGKNRFIDPTRMPLSLTAIPTNYSFLVRFRYADPATGLLAERFVTVISDDEMTIRQIEESAQEFLEDTTRYELEQVQSFSVVRAIRRNPNI